MRLLALQCAFVLLCTWHTAHASLASEVAGLTSLWYATSGPTWRYAPGQLAWFSGNSSHCDWAGIKCTSGHVTSIDLEPSTVQGLDGELTFDLCSSLPALQSLTLEHQAVFGSIPSTIWNCAELQQLILVDTFLSGELAPQLFVLPRLAVLYIQGSFLSGPIPPFVDRSDTLQWLTLAGNLLSGDMPQWLWTMPNLFHLDISANQLLTGSIPEEVVQATSLKYLDISFTQVSGALPFELFTPRLQTLLADGCGLRGGFPASLPLATSLQTLSISFTRLAGTIPAALFTLPQLQALKLEGNYFTGTIPSSIGSAAQLTQLSLEANLLTGPLPAGLFALPHLATLDMDFNGFTGTLPSAAAGYRPCLEELSLAHNLLRGPVPAALFTLPALSHVALFGNMFTGPIPEAVGGSRALSFLNLEDNLLTGTLPASLFTLPHLSFLDLIGNSLTGTLPASWGNAPSMQELGLAANRLTGTIPSSVVNMRQLETLDLSVNQFTGHLPHAVPPRLQYLNVSRNMLSGSLPDAVFAPVNLSIICVDHNHLTGTLPASMSHSSSLHQAELYWNAFTGSLPRGLLALPDLSILDVGQNQLSGDLPAPPHGCNLARLSTFNNRGIQGTISPLFTTCPELRVLDVGNCSLTGSLPQSWEAVPQMLLLRASSNHLTGRVPPSLTALPNLIVLLLQDNHLTGGLPLVFGDAIQAFVASNNADLGGGLPASLLDSPQLQAVLVASSGLTGTLPTSASPSINTLGLAGNELTGTLPQWLQYVEAADVSHNRLRGGIDWQVQQSQLYLHLNRMSGSLAEVAVNTSAVTDIDVLVGNMWQCPITEQWRQDSHYDSYLCYGLSAHTTSLLFAALLFTGGTVAVAAKFRDKVPSRGRTSDHNLAAMARTLLLTCLFILVASGVMAALYWSAPSFYEQRYWMRPTVIGVGNTQSGIMPFAIAAALQAPAIAIGVWWAWHMKQVHVDAGTFRAAPHRHQTSSHGLAAVLGTVLLCFIPNAAYVVATKGGYVAVTSEVKAVLRLAMAMFKSASNTWLVPRAASAWAGEGRGVGRQMAMLRMATVLQHINSVVIPVAATLLLQDECLRGVLLGSSKVLPTLQVPYPLFKEGCEGLPHGLDLPCTSLCTALEGQCKLLAHPATLELAGEPSPQLWSATCPSTFFRQYGDVILIAGLLQGVGWAAVPVLRGITRTVLGEKWSKRGIMRLMTKEKRYSKAVAAAYRRMGNIVELMIVFGPFYPYIAVCGVLSMAAICLVLRVRGVDGEVDPRDKGEVPGPPGMSILLTVVLYACMCCLVMSGGEMLDPTDWGVGVVCGAGVLIVTCITFVLVVTHCSGRAASRRAPDEVIQVELSMGGQGSERWSLARDHAYRELQ